MFASHNTHTHSHTHKSHRPATCRFRGQIWMGVSFPRAKGENKTKQNFTPVLKFTFPFFILTKNSSGQPSTAKSLCKKLAKPVYISPHAYVKALSPCAIVSLYRYRSCSRTKHLTLKSSHKSMSIASNKPHQDMEYQVVRNQIF